MRYKTEKEAAFLQGIQQINDLIVGVLQERCGDQLYHEARPGPPSGLQCHIQAIEHQLPDVPKYGQEVPRIPSSPKQGMYKKLLEFAPEYNPALFPK